MDMPIFALTNLKVDFKQVFACDGNPACRRLISSVHKPDRLYHDIVSRPFSESDAVDLYIWGAPCQPFSTAGKNHGAKDRRCLAKHALRYMKQHRPKAVLMENVSGLVKRHRRVFKKIKGIMSRLGYEVHARLVNTENHGIPHRRVRVYVAALLREPGTGRKFSWPKPVPACKHRRALAPIGPGDKPGGLPPRDLRKGVPRSLVKRAYRECIAKQIDPRKRDVFVDVHCTEKFYQKRLDSLPTLSACRGEAGGYWISSRGRMTTLNELFHLQGLSEKACAWHGVVSARQMGRMLGNTMSLNVCERVLGRLLFAADLVQHLPRDRWV